MTTKTFTVSYQINVPDLNDPVFSSEDWIDMEENHITALVEFKLGDEIILKKTYSPLTEEEFTGFIESHREEILNNCNYNYLIKDLQIMQRIIPIAQHEITEKIYDNIIESYCEEI